MARCPICGGAYGPNRLFTDESQYCTCTSGSEALDSAREISGYFDYITPAVAIIKDVFGKAGKTERWVNGEKIE